MIARVTLLLMLLQGIQAIPGAPPPGASAAEPPDLLSATADPDVVYRGRSTTLTVIGASVEALKTLGVKPGSGVRIASVKELPPPAEGLKAVAVTVDVDRDAAIGPREITLLLPPDIDMDPNIRGGADQRSRDMDEYYKKLVAQETKPHAVGQVFVNAHELQVTAATARVQGEYYIVDVTIRDDARDLLPVDADDLDSVVLYESKCPSMTASGTLGRTAGAGPGTPTTASLRGRVFIEVPDAAGSCGLRVRAKDRAGNMTPWFAVKR